MDSFDKKLAAVATVTAIFSLYYFVYNKGKNEGYGVPPYSYNEIYGEREGVGWYLKKYGTKGYPAEIYNWIHPAEIYNWIHPAEIYNWGYGY